MNYLIDTHILIWHATDNKKLSPNTLGQINSPKNTIYLSHASLWEITIKKNIGKLDFPSSIEILKNRLALNSISLLNFELSNYESYISLPLYHQDPFDRMIISQAIDKKLVLITQDEKFRAYQDLVEISWS